MLKMFITPANRWSYMVELLAMGKSSVSKVKVKISLEQAMKAQGE